MKKILTGIVILLTSLLFLVNALSYLTAFNDRFGLLTHFRVQYLWLFALFSVFFIIFFNKKWLAIAVFGLLLNAVPVLSFGYLSNQATITTSKKSSLLLSNVLSSNSSYHLLLDRIQTRKPDFIVILELSHAWARALKPLDKYYPFQKVIPRNDNFGIALYSRFPLSTIEVKDFAHNGIPSIIATAQLFNHELNIIATHPLPPITAEMTVEQQLHLKNLADYIKSNNKKANLLAGDFNSTPWSPIYKTFIDESGLFNTRRGHGIIPSWPSDLKYPLLQIPLDHILTSSTIQTAEIERLEPIGSDHYPILLQFSF